MKSDDTISRQAAIDVMCELMHHWFGGDPKDEIREIKRELEELPTADPVKHGKWTDRRSIAAPNRYECSVCKRMTTVDEFMGKPMYAYCPWCGAKLFTMRGEEDEADA